MTTPLLSACDGEDEGRGSLKLLQLRAGDGGGGWGEKREGV